MASTSNDLLLLDSLAHEVVHTVMIYHEKAAKRLQELERSLSTQLHRYRHRDPPREPVFPFPSFSRLPAEIRYHIWDLAIPRRYVMAVKSTANRSILQPPPVVANVSAEARHIATRRGGMWRTEANEIPQWTWFQPDRDVVIYTWEGSLCQLPSIVETIVVSARDFQHVSCASSTFDHLLKVEGFHNLKTIYIELRGEVTMVDKYWSPDMTSELFGSDKIVLPNMERLSSGVAPRLFRLLEREKLSSNSMPSDTFELWREHIVDPEHEEADSDAIQRWANTKSQIQSGWANAMALLTPGVGLPSVDGEGFPYLDRHTMMPFGDLSWHDYFTNRMPEVIPTCGFALVEDRRKWEHNPY